MQDIDKTELITLLKKSPYLQGNSDTIGMKDHNSIDFVEFYKWYCSDPMIINGIVTEFYESNINDGLLGSITKLQENIKIPDDKIDDCLFILTLSPSALQYALHPDEVIVNSRKMGAGAIAPVNKFHSSYFMNKLADLLQKDLQNSQFSTFYCRYFGLNGYSIETEMSLRFVNSELNKKINFSNYVSFLNANGKVVPMLLSQKPEE